MEAITKDFKFGLGELSTALVPALLTTVGPLLRAQRDSFDREFREILVTGETQRLSDYVHNITQIKVNNKRRMRRNETKQNETKHRLSE